MLATGITEMGWGLGVMASLTVLESMPMHKDRVTTPVAGTTLQDS